MSVLPDAGRLHLPNGLRRCRQLKKGMIYNLWLAISARIDALWCWLKGHDVSWCVGADECCTGGDIICHICNLIHWCRWYDPWRSREEEL